MAITSHDIEKLIFSSARRGYNFKEVDRFLSYLSNELDAMASYTDDLQRRLDSAESQLQFVTEQFVSLQQERLVECSHEEAHPMNIEARMSEKEIANYIMQQAREGKSAEEAIRGLFEVFGFETKMVYFKEQDPTCMSWGGCPRRMANDLERWPGGI